MFPVRGSVEADVASEFASTNGGRLAMADGHGGWAGDGICGTWP